MAQIQYLDDLDDMETEAFITHSSFNSEKACDKASKKTNIYYAGNSASRHLEHLISEPFYRPIERSYKIKPYIGQLSKPPSKMIFATWTDSVSYTNAWQDSSLSTD